MSLFRSGVVVIRFKSLQAAPLHSKGHWTDKNSYIKITKTRLDFHQNNCLQDFISCRRRRRR